MQFTSACLQAARDAWEVFRPGGQLHPQYFLEHKWNFIFEGILCAVIAYMFLQRSGPKKKQDRPLSEKVMFGASRPACRLPASI